MTNGVPNEIVGVDADIASHAWHTLAVQAKDEEFVVSLDGVWVFTEFAKTLSQAGRVALWTEHATASYGSTASQSPLFHHRRKITDVIQDETARVRSGSDQGYV